MPVTKSRIPSDTRSPRMGPLARLPVFFSLGGKRAVLAGGSAAAAWKSELLSAAGADVEVFAPDACEEMILLAAEPPLGAIRINQREWTPEDFKDAAVAVGAFEDDEAAAKFA